MSFEWSNVFNKQMSKLFERFDEFFAFFERMIEVVLVRTNANFFQTVFKQLLNGIPFENGKSIKHIFWRERSLPVHPFDLIRSKMFISRSSVRPPPLEKNN